MISPVSQGRFRYRCKSAAVGCAPTMLCMHANFSDLFLDSLLVSGTQCMDRRLYANMYASLPCLVDMLFALTLLVSPPQTVGSEYRYKAAHWQYFVHLVVARRANPSRRSSSYTRQMQVASSFLLELTHGPLTQSVR